MKKTTNYANGHFAEKIATWFLRFKGYHLVTRNYVTGRGTGAGEIDLIMTKGKTLVFFEIKKRKNFVVSAEAITAKNKQRCLRGAEAFLKTHPKYRNYQIRFDAVLFEQNLWPHHIPNAWHA